MVVLETMIKLVKSQIKLYKFDIDISPRLKGFLKSFCRVYVFERAIQLEFSGKNISTFSINDYLRLEKYFYCTTDIAFIMISWLVNNIFSPFDRLFFKQFLLDSGVIENDNWHFNPLFDDHEIKECKIDELIKNTIGTKDELQNFTVYAKNVNKTFDNIIYSEQDVIDFLLKCKRIKYDGRPCMKFEMHGFCVKINKAFIEFYRDKDHVSIDILNNIANIVGMGVVKNTKGNYISSSFKPLIKDLKLIYYIILY